MTSKKHLAFIEFMTLNIETVYSYMNDTWELFGKSLVK